MTEDEIVEEIEKDIKKVVEEIEKLTLADVINIIYNYRDQILKKFDI